MFISGMALITFAPFIGWLPGPGGVLVFLGGIAVLATEFDWAENLQEFVMKKVPEEVGRRWRPTPRWALTFDITTLLLLAAAVTCYAYELYIPVVSLTTAAVFLTVFNRNRLERVKRRFKRK